MKCVVVGLGEFGMAAAIDLAASGAEVIAMDLDMRLIEEVKDKVELAVCADASIQENLVAHGVQGADVLVAAIGEDFEAQVLVVVIARTMGVGRIVARATTPNHARVLQVVGADLVLHPEQEAAHRLVQRLLVPNLEGYFELQEGFSVVEVQAPERVVGKSLVELDLRRRFRINVIAIKRAEEGGHVRLDPIPLPSTVVQAGDVLAVVGSDLDIAAFLEE